MKRALQGVKFGFPTLLLCCLVLLIVAGYCSVTPFSVEQGENADASLENSLYNYGGENLSYAASASSALPKQSEIFNIVIFICFSDEPIPVIENGVIDSFNGGNPSLQEYYYNLSYGEFTVTSLFPIQSTAYYVYQDVEMRSYYSGVKDGTKRYTRESALLNNAVRAAKNHLSVSQLDLDADKDGYLDSVSFLVTGDYNDSTDWATLLWPHSWDLESISSVSGNTLESVNNLKVKKYAFNFLGRLTTGLICHEFGHVLGLPDLYHYNYDTAYLPMGYWDLMHQQGVTPQMTTTYLRYKYLGFAKESQIVEISESGTYTLSAASLSTLGKSREVLAYKITINQYESIWMEYRDNAGKYDNVLPGSGLIVYRVNNKVNGNENGKYQSTSYPDEVYLYRPSVATTGTTKEKEATNLSWAYLSPNNTKFAALGKKTTSTKYDQGAIYLTDGSNTGFRITADAITRGVGAELTFTVDLNDSEETGIESMYVEPYSMLYGETPNITLRLKYTNSSFYVIASKSNYVINYDPTHVGVQTAVVLYEDKSNVGSTTFQLTITDYIPEDGVEIISSPTKREYRLFESPDLTGLNFTVTYASGKRQNIIYTAAGSKYFTVTNFDNTKSGAYHMRVSYTLLQVTVSFDIFVLADLDRIRIDTRNTKNIMKQGEALSLHVIGIMLDGTERRLAENEYSVSGFMPNLVKEAQTVTVTSLENGTTATTKITVLDVPIAYIVTSSNPKTTYHYGEALDLSAGQFQFVDENNASIYCPMESYYDEFNKNYNPKSTKPQSLSVTIDGVVFSLTVKVEMMLDNILTTTNSMVSVHAKTSILLQDGMTFDSFCAALESYLEVAFFLGGKELVAGAGNVDTVDKNFTVLLRNAEGVGILELSVYLVGDANGDGQLDEEDVSGLADALLHQKTGNYFFDIDGDGAYTLSDFVQLVAKIRERGAA